MCELRLLGFTIKFPGVLIYLSQNLNIMIFEDKNDVKESIEIEVNIA